VFYLVFCTTVSSSALDSNLNNVLPTSTSLRWLLHFLSRGSNNFALICSNLALITTLCGIPEKIDHLFSSFLVRINKHY
jgi:hypothetical protein